MNDGPWCCFPSQDTRASGWGFLRVRMTGASNPGAANMTRYSDRCPELLPVVSAPVAHVGAAYPENHIFGNIGGVVRDALQVSRDKQNIERRTRY